ncbi:hypothetical protein [Amnibacterium sp.]|uniref:hypothetical protein n=1 Tax=Amnibacterium sp. TaxID=1872496 RepID=UPI0026342050|nr:hypothetical protein [Amnibacterium sp.]MCU1472453.1 carbonic anhydrase [Amnibacterium sp.]
MIFGRGNRDTSFPKGDQGKGSLDDYKFDLTPANGKVTIRLAGSDPHQEVLASAERAEQVETAIGRRTDDEERTDAPMPVRLFVDGRIIGPVGMVPRGLEAAVSEAVSRLETAGRKPRIPVEVVRTKQGLRVDLLLGHTR